MPAKKPQLVSRCIGIRGRSSLTGFTLLEIVIAMLILSLVVAGIFGMFTTSSKFIAEARHRLQAVNYARMVAEHLKVYVSADSSVPAGADTALTAGANKSFSLSGVTIAPSSAIPNTTGQECGYTITNNPSGATGLKETTVTVTWTEE